MGQQATGAEAYLPEGGGLAALREAVDGCRGCGLYRDATQAVFGAGPAGARLLLAGEQPGDAEDRRGAPFVGPAGRVLDDALEAAGIPRDEAYVTNVVKHFKFTRDARGSRRIHRTPSRTEVVACRPWLDAEIAAVGPEVVVCLGATAAKAVLGPGFRVTRERGRLLPLPDAPGDGPSVLATVHPSSVLRSDPEQRRAAFDALVEDLRVVAP
ncbi:UdgX family uracil-DNA binding protein [Pseudonocardia sp. C8]|uniref:UdgX family uracil-DNA binding protein n=1 Tax=Pseudonocardia sp. C8 TaxID=2762759 RepID=UPI0016433B7B|nr:UdgX family uracil-DNA binding protein [Pseudonocardia sp. C8]MBC3192318.1 UdgX family uracil-DNA binding protein [Pseudonocardia sp. C8]